MSFSTDAYPVEAGVLYEIQLWLRMDAATPEACLAYPMVDEYPETGSTPARWRPPNYWGVIDTSNYPNGWRRLRFPYVAPVGIDRISVIVGLNGIGEVWVDDLSVTALSW